jgi:hypothetical protein
MTGKASIILIAMGVATMIGTEIVRSVVHRRRERRDGLGGTQDIAIWGDIHRTGVFYRSRHLWFVMEITTLMPNQCAAANRRPALRFTMLDNLNIFTAFHAHGPAVAELDR